ncbi:TonB-dependent receptor [Seonamhaeicola marinus]|uniref:TonB-dependent receptor n=1 Tax=Seonamhaeicola marinus TaxID=1912246 RepID=A0A5D0J233_9FLAO|nr:TonB-dependent receptor [Seonamhaeicola marinus]TYA89238.1 TonB-dependent receptor [Seonamhaeicola marinus]
MNKIFVRLIERPKNTFYNVIYTTMRVFVVLIIFGLSSVYANSSYSQEKLDINVKNISLEKLFNTIQKSSNYIFFYNDDVLEKDLKVTLNFKNSLLSEILDYSFANTTLDYVISDRQVVVRIKNEPIPEVKVKKEVQKFIVTGVVNDANGQPLPGANIIEKGTQNGTQTDFDGNFSFEVTNDNAVLIVSYIGFSSKEISLNGKSNVSVSLEENAAALDEIVVIGFGTTTRAKAVGAISTVKAEAFEQTPFNNASQALQGQVPGLIINNSSGSPTATPQISIRGGGTPLFVIDGVIRDEFTFSTINPEDIESMSFLKDAVSTAVYGTRAANGIVLVKTKRGKTGKISLRYSGNFQLSEPIGTPDMMNSYQWALMNNDAARYDGIDPIFTDDQLIAIRDQTDPTFANSNWPGLVLKDFAQQRRHNLSLSGGDDRTNYFVSLGYLDQDGILKSNATDLQRFNIRSNVSMSFKELGLDVSLNLDASLQKSREPAIGEFQLFRRVYYLSLPTDAAFNPDGTYAATGNPLALSDRGSGYLKDRNKYINTQLNVTWKVPGVKGLSTGVMASYRDEDRFQKDWNLVVPLYNPDGSIAPADLPSLSQSARYGRIFDIEARLDYKTSIADVHNISATAVYVQREGFNERFEASKVNFESSAVDQLFAGPADGQSNSGTASENAFAGVVGRLNYDYNGTYLLEFSGRYDGNDNFAPGQKWGFFPAIGGGWVASNESFMQSLKDKHILDNLKFRFGFGETGNVAGVNRFGYLSTYSLEPTVFYAGGTLVNGFSEGNLVSPNELTWFTTKSNNVGLDFASLNFGLQGSIDYFKYNTKGFLVSPEDVYSAPLGKNLPQIRSESERRRAGWEANLSYRKQVNDDLFFQIGGNASYFDELWVKNQGEDLASLKNPYVRQTHQRNFFSRVLLNDGYYQTEDDLLNSPRDLGSSSIQLGDLRYQDVNGDGKIDDDDERRIGKPRFPQFNYGLNFLVNYKAWSLNCLMQGTGDRFAHIGVSNNIPKDILHVYHLDYWSPENPNARFQRISTAFDNPNGEDSDHAIINAKYFRVKNLQLAYDFKKGLMKNSKTFKGCKMFLTGTNLFTVSDANDFFDPESRLSNSRGTRSGNSYPIQRTFTLGLNLEF